MFLKFQHSSQQCISLFKLGMHPPHFLLGLAQQILVFFKCCLVCFKWGLLSKNLCFRLFVLPSSFLSFSLECCLKLSFYFSASSGSLSFSASICSYIAWIHLTRSYKCSPGIYLSKVHVSNNYVTYIYLIYKRSTTILQTIHTFPIL